MTEFLSFQNEPYIFLPIGTNPTFDMSCFYIVSLLQDTNLTFEQLFKESAKMSENTNYKLDNFVKIHSIAEKIVVNYSKIVKCLNPNGGFTQLFDNPSYGTLDDMDSNIILLRNTNQHFEERIQELNNDNSLNNFYISVAYEDSNFYNWCIRFGNSGYHLEGILVEVTDFNIANLSFSSYVRLSKNSPFTTFKFRFLDIRDKLIRAKDIVESNILNKTPNSVKNCVIPHIIAITQS